MNAITDFFDNSTRKFPNKTALVVDQRNYTYMDLDRQIQNFASSLHYQRNSVISMMFENSLEFIVSYLGILKAGCVAHIIMPNIAEHNLAAQLQSANPQAVISSKDLLPKIEKIDNLKAEKFEFSELKPNGSGVNPQLQVEDIAYLIYTSGTTAAPKGIGVSHSNVVFTTNNIASVLGYSASDVDVLPLSLSHSFGLGCMHTSFFSGSTLVLHKNANDVDEMLNSIGSHNATTFAAVPTTLTKMLTHKDLHDYVSKLRLIITNSTSIAPSTVRAYSKMLRKGKIATYYGLTEASRSSFMIFGNPEKDESVGLPAPGVKIKLVNDKNMESKEGMIWIKGKNVVNHYWNNLEADKNICDGWIKTGDIGYVDSEGYLFLKGRSDDIINIGGEKVAPGEVERIVMVLPGVREAVAIGVKHESFGQVVKLFIQKSPGASIQKSDVLSHCIKNLERYKVPAQIEFIDELPRTEYGKIKRYELK